MWCTTKRAYTRWVTVVDNVIEGDKWKLVIMDKYLPQNIEQYIKLTKNLYSHEACQVIGFWEGDNWITYVFDMKGLNKVMYIIHKNPKESA